jgi:hypothetical protein
MIAGFDVIDSDGSGSLKCRYLSKEYAKMPAGTLENSNLASVVFPRLSRPLDMNSLSVPFQLGAERVDIGGSPSMESPVDPDLEGSALKGVCWALAIEGAAAICMFGLWRLSSLIR